MKSGQCFGYLCYCLFREYEAGRGRRESVKEGYGSAGREEG